MLRKAGLDPDKVLWKTARIAEERDLSTWLPFALSGIYSLIACAYGCKKPPKDAELFRSWGLFHDASMIEEATSRSREQATDNAISMFFGSPKIEEV